MLNTNKVCGTSSSNAGYKGNSKFNQPCSNVQQSGCICIAETKSVNSIDCCPFNKKQSKGVKSRVKMQATKKKRALPHKFITQEEYKAINECSGPLTKEQLSEIFKMEDKERERLMQESMKRKEEFRKIDMFRPQAKSEGLIEIEEEAKNRTNYIVRRAENMKLEQEEEIQKCNRIILETKCRAIRDAQVAEKRLIEHELGEEEKRLNDMMENERRWAIKEELRKEQEEAAKKQKFASSLMDQIKENEEQRMLEFDRKQEESRLINLSNIAWQQSEIAKLRNKGSENARIRQELAQGNEQLKHFKAMEEQENIIIDRRIQEYQRYKEEREEKLAEERRLEKLKKEHDKEKVAMQAIQELGLQSHIDDLNAARIQEEVEREWRQKEKEEAIKKAEIQKSLMEEREKQIYYKRIMQAIELERERREFEKIVRVQKEAFCREKKQLEEKQRKALIHRGEILKQVNEKERERIQTRQRIFEEGLAIRTEAEMHKDKLRKAIERKCDEMRSNRVPEMYINEVKRMIENIH